MTKLLFVPTPLISMPSRPFNVMMFPSPRSALPTVQSPPIVLFFPLLIRMPSPGKRMICKPLTALLSDVMRKPSVPAAVN